jgi:hypothetical protein
MKFIRNLKEFIIEYLPYLYAVHNLVFKSKIFLSRKSYAHTEEDLFILKEFQNQKGFYVDVGCHHPTRLNNCHLLYKKGWRGINIDISEFSIKLFNLVRTKDININRAVSLEQKKVRFYYDKLISLYISLNKRKKQLDRYKEIMSDTLTNIIDQTKFKDKKIDFLSIDAEGKDFEVLQSLNFERYDPKYICVEIYSRDLKFDFKKDQIYKYLVEKNYNLLIVKKENYIFKKKF